MYGCLGFFYILFNLEKFLLVNFIVKLIAVTYVILILINLFRSSSPIEQLIYGRDGRYNGILTFLSLIIVFVIYSNLDPKVLQSKLIKSFGFASILIVFYSTLQLIGLDPVKWDTVNIKYFGTFGNPNFLSSFLALTVIPIYFVFSSYFNKLNKIIKIFLLSVYLILIIYLIFRTYSLQGFIVLMSLLLFYLITLLYMSRKKILFYSFSFITFGSLLMIFFGTLNKGPFADLLYKSSLRSRGDFFRSAVEMSKEHWVSGVGADSFADYYLQFRDANAARNVSAEIADSAHNYFLDISATMGVFMLVLYIAIVVFTIYSFYRKLRLKDLIPFEISLFTIWLGSIIQSLVSPTNIVFLLFIFAISGYFIGNIKIKNKVVDGSKSTIRKVHAPAIWVGILVGGLILLPINMRDNGILTANNLKRIDYLLIEINKFPKSTTGFNKVMVILNNQNDQEQLIVLARNAARFNPRSSAAHLFIFESPLASNFEKSNALKALRDLDPNNPYFNRYK